ncbi:MAG: FAD-dependent oxidoreductase [Solirubrobacteraceae bacterium]
MTALEPSTATPDRIFAEWLRRFAAALEAGDGSAFADCFAPEGAWRDVLAFSWRFRTLIGGTEIAAHLERHAVDVAPRDVRAADGRMAPRSVRRGGRPVVEGFFDFDTAAGRVSGFVRLLADEGTGPRAWLVFTGLQELHGHEERIGDRRPSGVEWSRNFAGENWLDARRREARFEDRDPQVLIVGAGQSGLILAARLRVMGFDALVIERQPRVGDNWRTRYHSLTLHNEVWANSLPYIPFPPSWPTFVPKDKLAGFLEAYAELMELNVWTSTELVSAERDETEGRWTAVVRRDGEERTLTVPHLVLATGSVSGLPHRPALPGLDDFRGEVMHSTDFTTGVEYAGKRAVVVGTGNSGHDVAQDLHANGAEVSIVQRSPTCVVSLVPSGTLVYGLYSEGPVEDIDLITASIPYPLLRETYQWLTKRTCELDRELLEGLHRVGFETDFEPDGTGFHMRYLRTGGGYYINVGCSDLISDGSIGLLHARDLERLDADGVRLRDGRHVPADLVVLATGYENQQAAIGRMLGTDVAERLGPIWGFDDEGFMRGVWTQTGQEGLWIMGGALNEARLWSRFLAVQIGASLVGASAADDVVPEPTVPVG